MGKIRPIAFYLPQFYPTPENDMWWGTGFTEWTNVVKAKPLFPGHYQPRIPSELGYYDLRMPYVRQRQAELASEAGIEGFCYWHYWFNGRRLLDRVFTEVVESGSPDFPFCLCWANHSWSKKTWNSASPDILLVKQTYPGEQDYIAHFNAILPAFKDERYIKVDGKLLFGVFAPDDIPDTKLFFDTWNRLAYENGLHGFYFFGLSQGKSHTSELNAKMYNRIVYDCLNDCFNHPEEDGVFLMARKRIKRKLLGYPYTVSYDKYIERTQWFFKNNPFMTPCIEPDFDHSPRSGNRWIIVEGSTPDKWRRLCTLTKDLILNNEGGPNLLFIKSWNEWGEGNYLEPDLRYGKSYIEEMGKVFNGNGKG